MTRLTLDGFGKPSDTIAMLKGVFPVIPTLFTDDGEGVNRAAQVQVVEFAIGAGAHGLVFPGVASEYNHLTSEERGDLIALVAETVDGRVPIIGGASAPTSTEVIEAGRQARSVGIDHLMIMAPHGLGDELKAHRSFFSEISTALPGARFVLQNAPNPIGAGLSPEAMVELAGSNEAIAYVKEETLPSGPSISRVLSAGIPHLEAVFGGGGARFVIDELERGALGVMPAVELTDLHVALFEAHQSGDTEMARRYYRMSLPLLLSQSIYRMRLTKYVLVQRGIIPGTGAVRAPLPEMDAMTRRDIGAMIADLEREFPA